MTLRQRQSVFAQNTAKLILYAYEIGFEVTLGEALRTVEQQRIYVNSGKSKTMNSRHIQRLAIDLCLFRNGTYLTGKEDYRQLAEYWESLNPDNVAGYRWGWDANHFEMRPA